MRLTPYSLARLSAVLAAVLLICACTTQRSSVPVRTATEQLLDFNRRRPRRCRAVAFDPQRHQIFIDRQYFQGYDDGYAMNAIRTQFLKQGLAVVDDRSQAQAIVNVSSGALSTDEKSLLIGIPALQVPALPVGTSGVGARNRPVQDGAGQRRRQIRRHRLRRQDRQADRHHRSAIWLFAPDQSHDPAVLLLGRPAIWSRQAWIRIRCRCRISPTAFPGELGFTGNIDRAKSQ